MKLKSSIPKALLGGVALLLVFGLVGRAGAATLRVPNQFATIQAAVDAAADGDRVLVKKGGGGGPNGEYNENVVIYNKSITLKCKKGAVIDVSETQTTLDPDGAGGAFGDVDFSAGITIFDDDDEADGTTVKGCTVQFAKDCTGGSPECPNNSDFGDGIEVGCRHCPGAPFPPYPVDEITIKNCTLIGNESAGLELTGDHFLVKGNRGVGNDGSGFSFFLGSDGVIEKNVARGNNNAGIEVFGGERHLIRKNRALVNEESGIELAFFVDTSTIIGNMAVNNDDHGFLVCGSGNTVADNVARENKLSGFDMSDPDAVTGNKAIGNRRLGFDFTGDAFSVCGGIASSTAISRNVAIRNSSGFHLGFNDPSAPPSVSKNTATLNIYVGFLCNTCQNVTFSRNTATRNGIFHGFVESGSSGSTYSENTSKKNGGDGFLVADGGDGTTLDGNKVRKNAGDGIDIDSAATGVVITNNKVKKNRGTGIENNGVLTDITDNIVKGNRTDIAGTGHDGTGSVGAFTGNTFNTGGAGVSTPGTGPFDP